MTAAVEILSEKMTQPALKERIPPLRTSLSIVIGIIDRAQ